MRVAAVLVAAGAGERLGAGVPKALVRLAGEPLLVHAARAFARSTTVRGLVCVVPADAIAQVRAVLNDHAIGAQVCAGGSTRQESVARGLAACPPSTEAVAVHDAARPLVTPALIDRVVAALEPPWDGVAPGLPVVDTLKRVDRERVVDTVDRQALRAVQTPQVFPRDILARAHAQAHAIETDDLAVVEAMGGRVRVIEGERRNFKITYPDDLALAEALLSCA
jgi:2-C-methyl-D-erythritol 4-phosphate cytidylyltransferase